MRFSRLPKSRRGADDVVFEMGAVDALINRIFAHGDRGNFDVGLLAFLIIVVRPFAERPFVVAFMRRHDSFDNDFAARRHHEIHRLGFHDFQRLAQKRAGDFQFRADARLLADGGHIQCRMMANGESDFHRFVVIFVFRANIIAVIGRVDHQAELSFALLLVAIDADVDRAGAAFFADHSRRIDVGAGIAFVEGQGRVKDRDRHRRLSKSLLCTAHLWQESLSPARDVLADAPSLSPSAALRVSLMTAPAVRRLRRD